MSKENAADKAARTTEDLLEGLEFQTNTGKLRITAGSTQLVEISRNMLQKEYYEVEENGELGPVEISVATLPAQDYDQSSNDAGNVLAKVSKTRSVTPQVNFQNDEDPEASARIGYFIRDVNGSLQGDFEGFGTQSAAVTAYAANLIAALKKAHETGEPFNGTKTYTVTEPLLDPKTAKPEMDDEGEIIMHDKEYILFAREAPMITEDGHTMSSEDRASRRDEAIRYNGPKTIPLLLIGEVQGQDGAIHTGFLGLTYAEERNLNRSKAALNDSSFSKNSWLFGLGLFIFEGSLEDAVRRFPLKFSGEGTELYESVMEHEVVPVFKTEAAAGLQNVIASRIQAAKKRAVQAQKTREVFKS